MFTVGKFTSFQLFLDAVFSNVFVTEAYLK
jgi:hypothetical protein